MQNERSVPRWMGRGAVLAAAVGVLGGCSLDELLEVDAPDVITEEQIEDPGAAQLIVNSIVAQFECGFSGFTFEEAGKSDTWDRVNGAGVSGAETYRIDTTTGACPESPTGYSYYTQFQLSRRMAMREHALLAEWTDEQVDNRERLMATTSFYGAAAMAQLGEFFCEMSFDGGPLMTRDETLAVAEEWATQAIEEITAIGDFGGPNQASRSTTTGMLNGAYGLRARIRWARGEAHWAGALSDAVRVPEDFIYYVTRETAPSRWNKSYHVGTAVRVSFVMGPFEHWTGPPNPVTGESWPNPIPFTGYLNLGILPDGRALSEDQYPITTTANPTAVPDTRVKTILGSLQGAGSRPVPNKYTADGDDHPLVSWNDMWLIRAEIEGGQTAIDLVNDIRAKRGLPLVTYANAGNAEQIKDMIFEERRRDLWFEGRFWGTKIQNTDRFWFPRAVGESFLNSYAYEGGVTLIMPVTEYDLNENFSRADRATGCPDSMKPTLVD
jgi:hypothetical protein